MSGPVNPGNRDGSENAARPTVHPFAALSRTVARSPVVLKILPFRIGPGRDGVVLIKESSIEQYSLGLSSNSPNSGTTEMEYQFDLMHRTPTFGKIVSSTTIPYTVLPSSASLVESSGTLNVSMPDEPRPPVQHDLSQYSTSPMHIDHPTSSSQQRSQSIPRSGAIEPSPRLGSDTLVLVTQDRHALFVTCGDQGEFMIAKIIELRDIIGTLTYDRGLHDDVSNIERKRYREQDLDESYDQSSDDDDYSISDVSSISDTDSTVEDIASRIKSLGKDIQADRFGNALLVSSYQNLFKIIVLGQSGPGTTRYIAKSHQLEVPGVILHLKFLYTEDSLRNFILFAVFFIDESGIAKLGIYEWRTYRSLRQIGMYCTMPLPGTLLTPILMAPIRHESSIIFLTELAIHWMRASDVISAKLTLASTPFPREIMMNAHLPTAYFYPSFPQPSRLNHIPAFAYIISHSEIAHFLDYFYVAFDNGDIYIVAISSTNSLEIGYYTRISGAIGPAFVVVEGDFVTGRQDLVFAGGDMSSGGIYAVDLPPPTPPSIPSPNKTGLPIDFSKHAQISRLSLEFYNWAPVFDCHVLKTADPFRDRLFVTSGFQNEGGISQVRYGVDGQIMAGGPKFKDATDIFAFSHASYGDQLFFLLSLPWQSRLLALDSSFSSLKDISQSSTFPLDLSTATIAAQVLADGRILQITSQRIIVADIVNSAVVVESPLATGEESSSSLFQSLADVNDTGTLAAVSQRYEGRDVVFMYSISGMEIRRLPSYISLESDLSVLKLATVDERQVCIIGTHKPALYICNVDIRLGLSGTSAVEDALRTQDVGIPESIVTCTTSNKSQTRVLIGLRNGTLLAGILEIQPDSDPSECAFTVAIKKSVRLGIMPLKLQATASPELVYVLSDLLWRAELGHSDHNWLHAEQVIFEDLRDKPITAFCPLNFSPFTNTLVCLLSNRFTVVEIGADPIECVSSSSFHTTPKRLLYLDHVQAFAVSRAGTLDQLQFVDPVTRVVLNSTPIGTILSSSEEVYCLCDWEIEVNDKIYRYLVLGSGAVRQQLSSSTQPAHPRGDRGKLRILRVQRVPAPAQTPPTGPSSPSAQLSSPPISRSSSSASVMSMSSSVSQRPLEVDIKKQFGWSAPEAVWAITQFQQYSLAYAAGSKVYLKTLNVETLKFDPNPAEITIRSPAVNLSSDGDLIYVSTRNNSIVVLAFRNNALVFVESDPLARSMLHHQVYTHNFVVGADKDRAIFGLYGHDERRHFSNMGMQFKFVLPTAVSRLRIGRFVPVRDHPDIDDGAPHVVFPAEGASIPDPEFEDVIVAAGINGAVFGIRILSQEEYVKLSYHFRRVVREICRHYRRQRRTLHRGQILSENRLDAERYPLELGLIPKEYGISRVLVDSNVLPHGRRDSETERDSRKRRISIDMIEVPSGQLPDLTSAWKFPSEASVRYIDGDVFVYLNDLFLHLRSLRASNIEHMNSHSSSTELQDPNIVRMNTPRRTDNSDDDSARSENSDDSDGDDSLYNDSSAPSHYYRFAVSMADDESHLQSQEWINRLVNGIVL